MWNMDGKREKNPYKVWFLIWKRQDRKKESLFEKLGRKRREKEKREVKIGSKFHIIKIYNRNENNRQPQRYSKLVVKHKMVVGVWGKKKKI